jgi:hypothetical protein
MQTAYAIAYAPRAKVLKRASRKANPRAHRTRNQIWSQKHPDWARENLLRRRYGLTVAMFDELRSKQWNRCKLCGEPFSDEKGKRAVVDHDHQTGAVRGLLHSNCNKGLGFFSEDPDKLLRAAAYLQAAKGIL